MSSDQDNSTPPSPEVPPDSPEIANSAAADDQNARSLATRRAALQALLKAPSKEGDVWYIVSSAFLERVFTEQAEDETDLATTLGPLDFTSIVDHNGVLYPIGSEPVPTYNVPPAVFLELKTWFGIRGEPVARSVVLNPENATKEIERNPPRFTLHQLARGNATRGHHAPSATITLSQTRSFGELMEMVRARLFKLGSSSSNSATSSQNGPRFRLWFLQLEEDIPPVISLASFVHDIPRKLLVVQTYLHHTLKSQGVDTAGHNHILVENADRTSGRFPVDTYLASFNFDKLDYAAVSSTGGNLGLANLGNTCYMNLALQCLLHVPEINHFFFLKLFENELNKSNPLGNKGDVANAFGSLLLKLFDTSNTSYVSPRDFKHTVGRYSSLFQGYLQQDSQEFLSWLLDALHEDLNRIYNKPYCEKPELADDDVGNAEAILRLADTCWKQHKQRNDSVIVDLFTGMYQSTLVCPDCSKTSITFDPYNDLTLPLPIEKKWYHTFTIVDDESIRKLEVELNKTSNVDELLAYLSRFLDVPTDHLFLFEIFRNFFYRDFQQSYNKLKFFPISEVISDADEIVVYIIPHEPESDIIVPVVNVVPDSNKSYNLTESFGFPFFIVLNDEEVSSFGIIRKKLEQKAKILSKELETEYVSMKGAAKEFYTPKDFPLLNPKEKEEVEDSIAEDDEGYFSDVSFANPSIGANFGFEVRYYHDHRGSESAVLNVPRGKPHLHNLPKLAEKLPDLKRKYYHYADYANLLSQEILNTSDEASEAVATDLETAQKNDEDDEFVMVNNDSTETTTPPKAPQLLDEESDNNLCSLFDDGLAPPQTYTESIKPSVENSPGVENKDNHPILVSKATTLVCEWEPEIYDRFLRDRLWEDEEFIPNPELQANKAQLARQQKSTISLYDCLKSFNTPEVLGGHDLWYCPRCKDHKQATKTIQIWSTGDILTIHLKRFQSARHFSDKIDAVVDFPIEGLDISPYVSSPHDGDVLYDLIAVDNHYGGLGGGHYTASAKNFRDDQWYYFNDGRVTTISDPAEVITGAAYLLFYRKRGDSLGGENLKTLIEKGRMLYEAKLSDVKANMSEIMKQTDVYNELQASEEELLRKLLEDKEKVNDDTEPETSSSATNSSGGASSKKSRSPITEEDLKDLGQDSADHFNKRKQRLISKSDDNNKSVHINNNISSSPASSTSSSDDNLVSDNLNDKE